MSGAGIPDNVRRRFGEQFAVNVVVLDSVGEPVTSFGSSLASTPSTGQVLVAVTGTAVQFPSNSTTNGVIITANVSNAGAVSIGGSSVNNTRNGTGNGYVLEPGASVSAAVDNTSDLYVNGTSGDWVSFIGS